MKHRISAKPLNRKPPKWLKVYQRQIHGDERPLSVQFLSFSKKKKEIGQITGWRPLRVWHPRLGNPGSATAYKPISTINCITCPNLKYLPTFSAIVMGTQKMIQETQTTIALGTNPSEKKTHDEHNKFVLAAFHIWKLKIQNAFKKYIVIS